MRDSSMVTTPWRPTRAMASLISLPTCRDQRMHLAVTLSRGVP